MTEEEWLTGDNPSPMLDSLQDKAGDRKLRLFAVACCRQLWHLLTDERSKTAVEVAEEFADGRRGKEDLARAWETAGEVSPAGHGSAARHHVWHNAHTAAWEVGEADAFDAANMTLIRTSGCVPSSLTDWEGWQIALKEMVARQCFFLRCIFGPLPFHSVPFAPSWRTSTVLSLAKTIYDQRQFQDMPILGDALEDAGGASLDILDHCRQPGVHVRGCWCLDLIQGKSWRKRKRSLSKQRVGRIPLRSITTNDRVMLATIRRSS